MKNNIAHISDTVVQIFTRTPEAGKCKSRLAKTIGAKKSATIQAHMLDYIVQALESNDLYNIEIWYEGSADYFRSFVNIPVFQQQGDNLGSRMKYAMQHALRNYTKVIIIGSDCVGISVATIQQTILQLDSHDVVIAPAYDGGYALIGSKQGNLPAFNIQEWGNERVYERTLQALREDKLSVHELAAQIDVDTQDDLLESFNLLPAWREYFNKNNKIEIQSL